ncbi:MAG: hypothetical protein PHU47_00490 [Candidatus ainarchaeum sp.]|nr:hypothetical protein [Candidatus ainarchaeum sp.]
MTLLIILLILIFVFILGNIFLITLEKQQRKKLPIEHCVDPKIVDSKLDLLNKRLTKLEIEKRK